MRSARRTALPLGDRLVQGWVIQVEPDVLHLELPQSYPHARWARVRSDDMPEGQSPRDYDKGANLDIFLLRPTPQDSSLWHANSSWSLREKNPWFSACPAMNDEVRGYVIRYVNEYAAVVRLDNGMDVMLHRGECPGIGFDNMADHVHVGDRVAGEVSRVDLQRLDIRITILPLLEKRRREEELLRQKEPLADEPPDPKAELPTPRPTPIFSPETQVLLVDDDQPFCRAMKSWLDLIGARTWFADRPDGVQRYLEKETISHVLCDRELGDPQIFDQVQTILAASGCRVAIISGNREKGMQAAQETGWPFLAKPLDHPLLVSWLQDGTIPREAFDQDESIHPLWHGTAEEEEVMRQGDRFLAETCARTGCLGAIWVKQERPGYFSIRARHGLDESLLPEFSQRIAQSSLATVIETGEEMERDISRSGPLQGIAPAHSRFVWVMPLVVQGRRERGVAFYRASPFDASTVKSLQDLRPEMIALVEHLTLIQHLQESEAFATVGRVAAGTLHEVRGAAGILGAYAQELENQLKKGVINVTSAYVVEKLHLIVEQAQRVADLAGTDLGRIRKARKERIEVNRTVERLIELFRKQLKSNVRLELHKAPEEITINLPPPVLEQSLINLLDNALFHAGKRSWGRVVVQVELDLTDSVTPLRIQVTDNGPGMTATEQQNLHTPRITSKGEQGTGLGIYISRNLLRSVGGDLTMDESIRWLGSRFSIHLPVRIGKIKDPAS